MLTCITVFAFCSWGHEHRGRLNKRPKVTLKINGRAEINSNCALALVTEHSINKSTRPNLSSLEGRGAYQIPGKLRSLFLNKQSVRQRFLKTRNHIIQQIKCSLGKHLEYSIFLLSFRLMFPLPARHHPSWVSDRTLKSTYPKLLTFHLKPD